jgi:hypothetical protein
MKTSIIKTYFSKFISFFVTTILHVTISTAQTSSDAWINEIHYDDTGSDADEGVEIVVKNTSTYPLSNWTVILYNGSNSTSYGSIDFSTPTSQSNSDDYSIAWKAKSGVQNGAPDGLALVYNSSTVIQFLSYEGNITASGGAADGLTSTDIGVSEGGSTSNGYSLQISGSGYQYSDFTWQSAATATAGNINTGQTLTNVVTISGDSGFRFFSTPVSNGTYSDLLDELWTQCMANSDGGGVDGSGCDGNDNVWSFALEDGAVGTYTALSDLAGTMTAGAGFLVYVFADNDYDGTADLPVTLSVSGTENSGDVRYPAGSDNISVDQYGLAGNPYATTIDWDGIKDDDTDSPNISDVVYVYDYSGSSASSPDVDEGQTGVGGIYRAYNGSAGSLTGGLIAPYQGFWVLASGGSGYITIKESHKSSSSGTFYRITDDESVGSMVFNFTSGNNYFDQAYLTFHGNGDQNIDNADAYKLMPLHASDRLIGLTYVMESAIYINNLSYEYEGAISVPFDVMRLTLDETNYVTMAEGVTLTWDLEELPDHIELILTDNITGTETILDQESEYVFTTEPKGSFSANYDGPIGTYPVVGEPRFTLSVTYGALGQNDDATLPSDFALHPIYPNPFNPSATISFDIPDVSLVALNVYDVKGSQVETLLQDNMKPGKHHYNWEPQELPSGVYFMKLTTAKQSFTQKVTYIK